MPQGWRPTHPGDPTPGLSQAGRLVIVVAVAVGVAIALVVIAVRPADASDALASPTMPQEPSPEPPPWFGGCVEMPGHGFSVTLPEDWVALDTGADLEAQSEALELRFPDLAVNELAVLREVLLDLDAAGLQLFAIELSERTILYEDDLPACGFAVLPDVAGRLDEGFVNRVYQAYLEQPSTTDIEPPTPVDLPVGPSWVITMTGQSWYDPGDWSPASLYVGAGHNDGFLMSCSASERPDDSWLSIAETIGFLAVGD